MNPGKLMMRSWISWVITIIPKQSGRMSSPNKKVVGGAVGQLWFSYIFILLLMLLLMLLLLMLILLLLLLVVVVPEVNPSGCLLWSSKSSLYKCLPPQYNTTAVAVGLFLVFVWLNHDWRLATRISTPTMHERTGGGTTSHWHGGSTFQDSRYVSSNHPVSQCEFNYLELPSYWILDSFS